MPVLLQEFEEDALSWEDKLNRINALFDVWIDVQRRWVYLEGIFTGSADIKALLPVETSRFQRSVSSFFNICPSQVECKPNGYTKSYSTSLNFSFERFSFIFKLQLLFELLPCV